MQIRDFGNCYFITCLVCWLIYLELVEFNALVKKLWTLEICFVFGAMLGLYIGRLCVICVFAMLMKSLAPLVEGLAWCTKIACFLIILLSPIRHDDHIFICVNNNTAKLLKIYVDCFNFWWMVFHFILQFGSPCSDISSGQYMFIIIKLMLVFQRLWCWVLIELLFCRKNEEQKPKEQRFKANENKPVMTEWWQQWSIPL